MILEKSGIEKLGILKKFKLLDEMLEKYNRRLKKVGFTSKEEKFFKIAWIIIPFITFIISTMLDYRGFFKGIIFLVICGIFQKLNIEALMKKRNQGLNKNIYRMYKFLFNQVSAGVTPGDSIINLHKVVEDKFLEKKLKNMALIYYQTLDIDLALMEVKNFYDDEEIDPFCIVVKQGVETGENLLMLKRQEELMFNKYFNYLEMETDRQKIKIIAVMFIFCLIIVLMIGIPLLMEMNEAMNQLFV